MKIKKELKKLINELNSEVYFTTTPPIFGGDDSYWSYKYFIVWSNTYNILYGTKTQEELIEFLNEVKNHRSGLIDVGSGCYVSIFEAQYV